jgi:hypothetical protein
MFIDVIIYMGVYKEPIIRIYWNIDFNKGPLYMIISYILLNRFE